jgi:hypothetical protein
VSRSRRLEDLEAAIGSRSDDPNMCFTCRGPGSYRREIDYARLLLGAEGKLFGADPEVCRARLAELGERKEPTSDHCPRCGGLNFLGAIRRERAKLEAGEDTCRRCGELETLAGGFPGYAGRG